jgi:hypothetical protein
MVVVSRALPSGRGDNLPVVASDGNRPGKASQGKTNLRLISRALFAVSLTALAAVIVRLRGSGGTPPHRGGWRELTEAELEQADKQ